MNLPLKTCIVSTPSKESLNIKSYKSLANILEYYLIFNFRKGEVKFKKPNTGNIFPRQVDRDNKTSFLADSKDSVVPLKIDGGITTLIHAREHNFFDQINRASQF